MGLPFNRRDFLKVSGLLPLGIAAPRLTGLLGPSGSGPNVLVVVFDALSALNLPLFGYGRDTTPNLSRLASRAIVYHNHFATANYTTPGTASLLTGTLPWTHRAIQHDDRTADRFARRNLFGAFPDYHRMAYTHNSWAYTLLRQFRREIEELVAPQKLFLLPNDDFGGDVFVNDQDISSVSWARALNIGDGHAYSLFVSRVLNMLNDRNLASLQALFPRGLPGESTEYQEGFLLEQAVDWAANVCRMSPQPFLAYFHFLPPHDPYNPPQQFADSFHDDHFKTPDKPSDVFAASVITDLDRKRRWYDQFVLYVDSEFGRFYAALEASGVLDHTWLIVTSDHGEMFERNLWGHDNYTLYQPLVRIPLLIFEPGREDRMDVHDLTSAVDLVPTLAHVTGHPVPDWTEGAILPPYAGTPPDPERSVYATQARHNPQYAPLTQASTMLVKDRYKLLYFFGYKDPKVVQLVKLYDIEADPEELVDLSATQPDVAAGLLAQLKSQLARADQPYL
jgi:arylsulfatase A-like enzyme